MASAPPAARHIPVRPVAAGHAPRPAPPRTRPKPPERTIVIDERNMVRIWLEEQISFGKFDEKEADERLHEYETRGKLAIGPAHDMVGSGLIVYRLARDMRSWRGVKVEFVPGKRGELVIIKGWPAGRKLLTGTRYRVDNPKIMDLQIGKPALREAARDSAKIGLIVVVAFDVFDYMINRDRQTFGHLLGALTVDVPSVAIASALGAMAGSAVAGSTVAGVAAVGAMACGPMLVALFIGVVAGYALYRLDEYLGATDWLGKRYDEGIVQLGKAWHHLDDEAQRRLHQIENSKVVHDLSDDARALATRLGRESDQIRMRLAKLW